MPDACDIIARKKVRQPGGDFRHAHLAVWLLIGVTVVAFWPGYLSRLDRSHWRHHLHALTALTWMALLIA